MFSLKVHENIRKQQSENYDALSASKTAVKVSGQTNVYPCRHKYYSEKKFNIEQISSTANIIMYNDKKKNSVWSIFLYTKLNYT